MKKIIATGMVSGELYKFRFKHEKASLKSYLTENPNSMNLWHKRMGHLNRDDVQKLKTMGLIEISPDKQFNFCESCLNGKQHKLPHNSNHAKTRRPLELIHSDVCDPINPTSWDNKNY